MNTYIKLLLAFLVFFNSCGTSSIKRINSDPAKIEIVYENLSVIIAPLNENTFRVRKHLRNQEGFMQSLVVENTNESYENWNYTRNRDTVIVTTPGISLKIIPPGKIEFTRKDDIVLKESGFSITGTEINGEKGYTVSQRFRLSPSEAIYGLGQQQDGHMNLRGKEVDLVQYNTHVAVPFLISTNGYGIFWDNYSRSLYSEKNDTMLLHSELADGIEYYFIAGASMDSVIGNYRKLTGKAPLFPKSAYGLWQSKERYNDQEEVLNVVREHRRRKIPLDNIVQDWFYWEPEPWGSHNINRSRYPNPSEMCRLLNEEYNVQIMLSVWGKFMPGSKCYDQLLDSGFLFSKTNHSVIGLEARYYDAFNPRARKLYWQQINDSLYQKGFNAFWLDATEPEIGKLSFNSVKSLMNNHLGSGARYLNAYPLMTTKAVYEGQREADPEKRVFILTRSAFAGQQRNASATWSGDIEATWDVFKRQIPAGLNFSSAGIPYWTTDIGAFFVQDDIYPGGNKNHAYRELFVRWFQYGVFCPIFRVHGSSTPREMWNFGNPGEWAYEALIKATKLRYRLMPYIYSLAGMVTHHDYTIMRPLAFEFPSDTNVHDIKDQFLFGPSIMVCPVTHPVKIKENLPELGEIIPAGSFLTNNNSPGLQVSYFAGLNFDSLVEAGIDKNINHHWFVEKPVEKLPLDSFSIRWTGKLLVPDDNLYTFTTRSDDGVRLWINDSLIIDDWRPHGVEKNSATISLLGKTRVNFKLEYFENIGGSMIELYWNNPDMLKRKMETYTGTRQVYLPGNTRWYNFWTGDSFEGGNTIHAECPIEITPLFVKAGSIIPLGPDIQYASEMPANPLEIRIYQGDDGYFELYEDENNNYNYEKGAFRIIPLQWNEKDKQLTIGQQKGTFPGLLKERVFRFVIVKKGKGIGGGVSTRVDKIINYNGEEVVVIF